MRIAKIQIIQGFQRKKHGFLKTGLVEFGKNLRKALNYALQLILFTLFSIFQNFYFNVLV